MHAIADDGTDLPDNRVCPRQWYVSSRTHRDDPANSPFVDGELGHAVTRVEAADVAHLENSPGSFGGLQGPAALLERHGHRLFEEDVLAGLERSTGGFNMVLPLCCLRDGVDAGIREHFTVVREGLAHVEFPCHRRQPFRASRGKCFEPQLGDAGDRFTVDFTKSNQSHYVNIMYCQYAVS